MRSKRLIVLCLLPAYLLLVLHAIIPHHHHFSAIDGPVSLHHGFNTHDHEQMTDDHHHDHDDHGHTAHFIHSPEFGNAMVRPDANWIDTSIPTHVTAILEASYSLYRGILYDAVAVHFPESPPHYISPATAAPSLRGPPSLFLI